MKSKRGGSGLFGLLARSYLLFILTLLALVGGIYLLWNHHLNQLARAPDWDALLSQQALRQGKYETLARQLTGPETAFAVLDGEGRLLYRSDKTLDTALTPGELACVPEYRQGRYLDWARFRGGDGSQQFLVTVTDYSNGEETPESSVLVLSEDYQVLAGSLGDGRTGYTPREFLYLTQQLPQGALLYRAHFTDAAGNARIALLRQADWNAEAYAQAVQSSWRVWLLFVPLCLCAAGFFIFLLSRRIRRPLQRLNQAVEAQAAGEPVSAESCGGPREIRCIAESFDRLCAQLAASETERQRLDQGRQKLIADISHDLKTPITVISGYADALCDGKVPPQEQAHYLQAIRGKAVVLTELIGAFHEYSKTEHPAFSLQLVSTELCEFVREYLAEKYDEVDLAGFTLVVNIGPQALFCLLDRFQFRRVLDNLLSNSLRHNRLGTLLFVDLLEQKGSAVLRVGDNGIGIPPAKAKTIFEPFVTGDDARSKGGSGLGLAITRRIVEKHGGSIWLAVPPQSGRSTEFVITLPLSAPP